MPRRSAIVWWKKTIKSSIIVFRGDGFMKIVPTGIENFKELIDKDACYVDKTNLIEKVLKEKLICLMD